MDSFPHNPVNGTSLRMPVVFCWFCYYLALGHVLPGGCQRCGNISGYQTCQDVCECFEYWNWCKNQPIGGDDVVMADEEKEPVEEKEPAEEKEPPLK